MTTTGWMPHKNKFKVLQKITLCGSNANHNWLLTLSTLVEMEKLNLWVSINRNRKSTSTVYTYMHDLDTSTPQRTHNAVLFSIASWRTLFRYALFFLCQVQFQCCFNTASNCKKVCTTESSFAPVEFGFWEGGVVLGTLVQFIMKLTGGGDVALNYR